MKKQKCILGVCFTLWLGAAGGAAQSQSPQNPATTNPKSKTEPPSASAPPAPDQVVIRVGEQKVTQGDFEYLVSVLNPQARQALATQGRQKLGEQYALAMVLSQSALRDHMDATPDFRRQMEFQRTQALAQAAYQHLAAQAKITAEEISQYYAAHPAEFERLEVIQVVVRKKPENAPKDTPGLSAEEAHTRFDAIRKALAGGADPKKVAEDFKMPNVVSVDTQTRTFGHGQLPADLDKTVFQLKDGELSQPLETPQGLYGVQVLKHTRQDFQEASKGIEAKLKQQKVEAAVAEVKSKASIWLDPEYFKPPQAAAPAPSTQAPPSQKAQQQ